MASLVSPLSSTPRFPINLSNPKPAQPQKCFILRVRLKPFRKSCMKVVSMAQFGEPNKPSLQIGVMKEKVLEAIPVPVKELPWKKAADIALKQLLFLGEKALKWSLLALCVLSFFSDIIFSISRNRELIIPFGLFVGCFITDILKETLQQVLPISEDKGFEKHLIGLGCLFAAVKFISNGLPMQAQVLLLNVANGGFLQVLWLWRGLLNGSDDEEDVDNSTDASLAM
ncbi:hypothetical protein M0R45_011804 [Rubus argutus]|uniref:Uncharacterized protein n=1 Tax=Rubus argutus TaxID=59490 RepID=A0AAW1YDY2_RUBAR